MMEVKLIGHTLCPMDNIEICASKCYDSQPYRSHAITKACYESGHESVLEHASFTFEITGVSRALLAQITRHRVGMSFSVRSQRYCNEDIFNYVIPPTIMSDTRTLEEYVECMESIRKSYSRMVDMGVPKEDARMVLPNACETVIMLTCNLRALIHFCNERMCNRAQWEIRNLAYMIRDVLKKEGYTEAAAMLVPKCERYSVPFCPEKEGCGAHPSLEEINE